MKHTLNKGISNEEKPSVNFRDGLRHKNLKENQPELYEELLAGRETRHCFMSEDGKFLYHIGIIDYLQDFNFDKHFEHRFKSLFDNGSLISCVPPEAYSLRFYNFMQSHVIINQLISDSMKEEISFQKIQRKEAKKQSHYHKAQR